MTSSRHIYEVRPRKDKRGADLISDALLFGRLWYGEPNAASNAVDYAKFYSRSHAAVIRVYDEAGNVIETHGAHGRVQRVVELDSFTGCSKRFAVRTCSIQAVQSLFVDQQ